jgi:hypothetical protein
MKKYRVDYSFNEKAWCVFEHLSHFLREIHQICENKNAAEKLAERLNEKEEVK